MTSARCSLLSVTVSSLGETRLATTQQTHTFSLCVTMKKIMHGGKTQKRRKKKTEEKEGWVGWLVGGWMR
jgi:hypothetical protein